MLDARPRAGRRTTTRRPARGCSSTRRGSRGAIVRDEEMAGPARAGLELARQTDDVRCSRARSTPWRRCLDRGPVPRWRSKHAGSASSSRRGRARRIAIEVERSDALHMMIESPGGRRRLPGGEPRTRRRRETWICRAAGSTPAGHAGLLPAFFLGEWDQDAADGARLSRRLGGCGPSAGLRDGRRVRLGGRHPRLSGERGRRGGLVRVRRRASRPAGRGQLGGLLHDAEPTWISTTGASTRRRRGSPRRRDEPLGGGRRMRPRAPKPWSAPAGMSAGGALTEAEALVGDHGYAGESCCAPRACTKRTRTCLREPLPVRADRVPYQAARTGWLLGGDDARGSRASLRAPRTAPPAG